jgi:hypothetical protein
MLSSPGFGLFGARIACNAPTANSWTSLTRFLFERGLFDEAVDWVQVDLAHCTKYCASDICYITGRKSEG